ncbi:MAG: hypothetical protein IPL59_13670 [Candidatus Competibacteraceae bacterium]|nr:hypothetical protein [Candidatus Competibacteraceae bacterium]
MGGTATGEAWQPITLRNGTKGALWGEILHRTVAVGWRRTQACPWQVIVRREIETPTEIKYSLSNAPPTRRSSVGVHARTTLLIERALQTGNKMSDWVTTRSGLAGLAPSLALVMMSMLFLLEERQLHHQTRPPLSGRDIRALLNHFPPQREMTLEEVLRQMVRHRKRQAAINSAYRKQQLNE